MMRGVSLTTVFIPSLQDPCTVFDNQFADAVQLGGGEPLIEAEHDWLQPELETICRLLNVHVLRVEDRSCRRRAGTGRERFEPSAWRPLYQCNLQPAAQRGGRFLQRRQGGRLGIVIQQPVHCRPARVRRPPPSPPWTTAVLPSVWQSQRPARGRPNRLRFGGSLSIARKSSRSPPKDFSFISLPLFLAQGVYHN